ncbi:MAG TPA: hypothetical protein VFV99_09590 [Kofleriaceae bacterium]|nr:hypothetical protein [Kofleriaceae bacterium]
MRNHRMRLALALLALAAFVAGCSDEDVGTSPVTGTVVFTERATQHIRVLDVGTGVSDLIDGGQFGSVSIAPDAAHVAYQGVDQIMKFADRSANVTPVLPGGGCVGPGTWLTSRSLAYCATINGNSGFMLLPDLDGTAPRFIGPLPAISNDGHQLSYVDARGDAVIEDIDGANRRVVVPSTDPTALYHFRGVTGFTPDDRAILISDYEMYPAKLRIVALADGSSIDVDDALDGSSPFGPTLFYGASRFSPDGSEIVLQSTTGLVAIDLGTGTKRVLAPFAPRTSSAGAVFLDAEHVLWVQVENHSVSDIGKYTASLHVAGPTVEDDRVLDAPNDENALYPSVAVSPEGFIAWPGNAFMMTMAGTVLVENDYSSPSVYEDILGLTPNGRGVIAITYDGLVRYVDRSGASRDLATVGGTGDLLAPYAAYTPASTASRRH